MLTLAGADDGVMADADGGKVQSAAGAGEMLRGVQDLLPGFPLRPQALLADQHGPCRLLSLPFIPFA